MPDAGPASLSRLTGRERAALRLLARGHDAKSAAAAMGCTPQAVHELLRGARAKLGVASSREAARLLAEASEKPGDEDSGVAARPAVATGAPQFTPSPRRLLMSAIAITLLSAAATAALTRQDAPPAAGPPRVVATVPTPGARVAAGPLTLRVTFDRPMRRDSFSFVETSAGRYPDCAGRPEASADGRSFALRCRLEPGRRYAVAFNGGRFRNFVGADGQPAAPMLLTFTTAE